LFGYRRERVVLKQYRLCAHATRAAVRPGVVTDVDEVGKRHVECVGGRLEDIWMGFSPAAVDAGDDGVERVVAPGFDGCSFQRSLDQPWDAAVRADSDRASLCGGVQRVDGPLTDRDRAVERVEDGFGRRFLGDLGSAAGKR